MKGKSLLWKTVSVLLGITILPVTVILAFFYPQNYEVLNHVIEDGLTEPAQRAVERLDDEFLQMIGTSIELKSSVQNLAWDGKESYLHSQQVKNLLKTAGGRSELVETVLLYQPDNGRIYSPTGTVSSEYFQNVLYLFKGKSKRGEPLEFDTKGPSVFPASEFMYSLYGARVPMLVFTYPLPGEMGYAIFLTSESRVRTLLSEVCGESRNYLLYDKDTLYFSAAAALSEEEMWNTVQKQRAGVEDDAHITYTGTCKSVGLTLQVFESKKQFYQELDRLYRLTIVTVLLIVAAGAAAILVILRTNYRPLLHILKEMDKVPGLSENGYRRSEYELLQSGIAYMQDSNSKLNSTLRTYREKYKSFFLYEFLSGGIQKINDLADVEERLEIEAYQRLLVPVFLELRGEKGADKSVCLSLVDEMNGYFRNAKSSGIQIIFSVCIEKSAVFCLVSMEETPDIQVLNDLEAFLRREVFCLSAMKRIGPFCAVVGKISENIYEAEENIQLLYHTLDSALLQGLPDYSVTDVEQLYDSEIPGRIHPVGRIYELTRAVESRDIEKIHGAVENIIQVLASASTSIAVAKLLFGQAMFVFRAANPSFASRTGNRMGSAELYSPSQMTEMLREQEKDIYLLFEQEIQTVGNHTRDVVAYVDEHFLDFNFSIAAVAEHYHMQISNMSAYFKKCYGVNFQQYVSQKKVERAKELLEDPELTLEDISQQLGYSNASSFSRTFKRIVGITPGTYRGKE